MIEGPCKVVYVSISFFFVRVPLIRDGDMLTVPTYLPTYLRGRGDRRETDVYFFF